MILKAIAQICKTYKCLRIVDANDKQWIGTPKALYPAIGLPNGLSKAEVCSMFDISEEKQEKMIIEHFSPSDLPVVLFGGTNNDRSITKLETKVCFNSEIYEVLFTSKGVRLLNTRYLKPLIEEMKEGYVNYYERFGLDNEVYACISDGFFIGAVIELDKVTEAMQEEMSLIYQAMLSTSTEPDEEEEEE